MRVALRTRWVIALWAVFALSCWGEDAPPPPTRAPVVLASVELRDVEESIEATGQLLAKDRAEIAAEVPGRITEILLLEGDGVALESVRVEALKEKTFYAIAQVRNGDVVQEIDARPSDAIPMALPRAMAK